MILVMKTTQFLTLVLITAMSAACYSTDKPLVSGKKNVAIVPDEKGKFLRVIYEADRPGKVRISLFADHWLLYHQKYISEAFIQPFDLEDLPNRQYQFEIQTPTGKVEKIIEVTDTKIYEITVGRD